MSKQSKINNENQANKESTIIYRYYTYTIKPCMNIYKGDSKRLFDTFLRTMDDMNAISWEYTTENRSTLNEHIHGIIRCPYIPNKMTITKQCKYLGYRIKFDVVRREFEEGECTLYRHYMNKELSDSERIYNHFGNLFLPVNDQE